MALGHILGFFGISARPNRFSIGDTLYEKISYITVTVVLIGLTYLMGRLLIGFLFWNEKRRIVKNIELRRYFNF